MACLRVKHRLWNINSIRGSGWYITIQVWKINNGKKEVISFTTETGWMFTICVKIEVYVKRWGSGICLLFTNFAFVWNIDWQNIINIPECDIKGFTWHTCIRSIILFWIHLCKALIHILLILISLYIARNNAPVIQFQTYLIDKYFFFKIKVYYL